MRRIKIIPGVSAPDRDSTSPDVPPAGAILILIPAFNEAQRIYRVVEGAGVHLPVLVVDDGSSDTTANTAERAGALVLRQNPNQGKGSALRAGFQHALAQDYQAVITLDADGQHDPGDIPDFIERWKNTNADLIIGQRDFSRIPLVRRIANTIGRVTFSWAVGRDIPDNQSGYRLISRRLIKDLLPSNESGFEFEVEMIKFAVQRNYRIEWVPIQTIYAGESSHISPFKHIQNFTRIVLQTRKNVHR